METVEKLRSRISTASDLQSVVKTMKGLSAVSIRSYEKAVEALADYSRAVELGLQAALRERTGASALLGEDRSRGGATVIVFGSEQGLCGPFNRKIVEHALAWLSAEGIASAETMFAAAGARSFEEIRAKVEPEVERFWMPASVDGITERVTDILVWVTHLLEAGQVRRVVLFHHRPLAGSSYAPRMVSLFPFDPEWLEEIRSRPWETRCLPAYFTDREPLMRSLVRQYLFVCLYRAFAESLASEHASRLAAMQAAENNIEERLVRLELAFHQARQASITEELLDVVSGFEALRAKSE
jgi:F-type H+-transporting ATPase subunit gamma